MPKVYDPILCMMVDKPATRTTDAKGGKYEIYGDVVTLKSVTPATVKYETSNGFVQTIGRKKWDELAKKVNDASYPAEVYNKFGYKFHDSASTLDKAIKTVDAANLKELKDDYGRLKNASSIIGNIYSLSSSTKSAILQAIESGMREIDTRIDRAYMK